MVFSIKIIINFKNKIMKFNEDLFFNSILQLLISIIIGTIVLYSSYKLIEKYLRKKHEIEIDNTFLVDCQHDQNA